MDIIDDRNVVINPLSKFWYQKKVADLDMLRLDLLHPVVSGNKWYKLRLNMDYAKNNFYKTVVTSGGGYSNHLIATAYAAKRFGLQSVGIVRGKYNTLTPTLRDCQEQGMELIFVTQEDYKNQHQPEWAEKLVAHFDEVLIIPEGGANERGRIGAGLINRFIHEYYTHVMIAVGTGTTMIGLRNKIDINQQILGFAPMKQGAYLKDQITEHLLPAQNENWELFNKWHFGGFGKWNDELISFMNDFYEENSIPLDLVYTSKMMFGIKQMLDDNYFNSSDRILCIHSGGLQGNVSVKDQLIY
jgi:1-aminocyclopropane-1-carboxylate deaminase